MKREKWDADNNNNNNNKTPKERERDRFIVTVCMPRKNVFLSDVTRLGIVVQDVE